MERGLSWEFREEEGKLGRRNRGKRLPCFLFFGRGKHRIIAEWKCSGKSEDLFLSLFSPFWKIERWKVKNFL